MVHSLKNIIIGLVTIFSITSSSAQIRLELLLGANSSDIVIYGLDEKFSNNKSIPRRNAFVYGFELNKKLTTNRIGGRVLVSRKGHSVYDGNLIYYLETSGFYKYHLGKDLYFGGHVYVAKKIKGRELFNDFDAGLGISLSYNFGIFDAYGLFQHGVIQIFDNSAFHYNQVVQLGVSFCVFEFPTN